MKSIAVMDERFLPQVVSLANQVHGKNYLDLAKLAELHLQGIKHNINASYVALIDKQVVGYRLSFAAGQWPLDEWCSVPLWPVPPPQMAYFKSVAVAPELQGQGLGTQLLQASIGSLQQQGATAGLAHIWQQSPGNAAQRYFSKAGASLLKVHADRWLHLSKTAGYLCPICGNRCHCTAAEMVLSFADMC